MNENQIKKGALALTLKPSLRRFTANAQNETDKKGRSPKITFRNEYLSFQKKFEIDYDEKYLFEFYD